MLFNHTRALARALLALSLSLPPLIGTTYAPVQPALALAALSSITAGSITGASAVITWTSDVPASSQVQFGPTTAYGASTTADPTLVTTHAVTLAALTGATTYHYRVLSTDASGAVASSGDASFTTLAADPALASTGQWSPVQTWPLVAVHSALLYTGEVITWDAWETNGTVSARIWNPATQTFAGVPLGALIFCSGQVELADGRLLVSGGHGLSTTIGTAETNIFDPATRTWTTGPSMHSSRWYPAATTMGDGRVVSLSGQITQTTWADTPEIFNPTTGTWSTLPVSTANVHEDEYPLDFLLPNGKLFNIAPSIGASNVLDVNAGTWLPAGPATAPSFNGSAAMFRPGQVLYTGGGSLNGPAVTTAAVVDMTQPAPAWQVVKPMAFPRYEHNLTVLADGQVLAIGGVQTVDQTVQNGSLAPEMFDPNTRSWTTMAAQQQVRQYHSTAMLLPDGRVLSAGGGRWSTATDYLSAEIYSPPYLFKGPRPWVTNAPASTTFGSALQVDTPDAASVAHVALTSLAADTHTSDMDQRYIELPFTTNPTGLTVQSPTSSNIAPAGYYMLWLVSAQGVPSFARMIRVTGTAQSDTQPPAVSVTAPTSGASLTGSVTLAASATDNVGVTGVQFRLDGQPIGASITAAPYSMTWDSSTVISGAHTLVAQAADLAGNITTSASLPVTVANATSPPTVLLGDQQIEGTGDSNPPGSAEAFAYTATTTGTANKVALYVDSSNTAPSIVVGLYANVASNAPGALLGQASIAVPNAGTWNTVAFPATAITAGAKYWIAALAPSGTIQIRDRATGSASQSSSQSNLTTLPATWSPGPTWPSSSMSVYLSGTTSADTQPPTVNVTAPAAGASVTGSVTVSASATDNVSVGNVQFTLDGANLGAPVNTAPYAMVWDTTTAANGSHTLGAKATDGAGNVGTATAVSVSVSNLDTTPPVISGGATSNLLPTGATVTWTTNEAATSQVQYGLTTSYGSATTLDAALATSHSQNLGGLAPATTYFCQIASRDAAGNLATATLSFATPALSVSGVTARTPTASGATIAWTSNESTSSQVEYGPTAAYGSSTTLDPTLVTSHSVALSGLTASTLYHYRVKGADAAGYQVVSPDFTFSTTALAPTVLVGDSNVEANLDSNAAGSAEAFQYTAASAGAVATLAVYLDARSTASRVVVGLYTNTTSNNPGTLLGQGTISAPVAGWNRVTLATAVNVSGATKYWIAVLGPSGAGTVQFRDVATGGKAQNSSQTTLSSLPATWSPGANWTNAPMSAYASP